MATGRQYTGHRSSHTFTCQTACRLLCSGTNAALPPRRARKLRTWLQIGLSMPTSRDVRAADAPCQHYWIVPSGGHGRLCLVFALPRCFTICCQYRSCKILVSKLGCFLLKIKRPILPPRLLIHTGEEVMMY